jgi:hypothetical protein
METHLLYLIIGIAIIIGAAFLLEIVFFIHSSQNIMNIRKKGGHKKYIPYLKV